MVGNRAGNMRWQFHQKTRKYNFLSTGILDEPDGGIL